MHEVIRVEGRRAVASLWLATACSSAMLLGTDSLFDFVVFLNTSLKHCTKA